MNEERDKFLTEAMGECWHDNAGIVGTEKPHIGRKECVHCGEWTYTPSFYQMTFSTWEDFGKLWEWAQKQEWYRNFLEEIWNDWLHKDIFNSQEMYYLKRINNPDGLANELYQYLKNEGTKNV